MAFDTALADRIRDRISAEPGVSEQRMFGGLAFLLDGHLCVAVSGRGDLLVRVDPDEQDALLARPHAGPWMMRGREARGWMRVAAEGVADADGLDFWIGHSVNWVQTLEPKPAR